LLKKRWLKLVEGEVVTDEVEVVVARLKVLWEVEVLRALFLSVWLRNEEVNDM
jgi:hypothetical protein